MLLSVDGDIDDSINLNDMSMNSTQSLSKKHSRRVVKKLHTELNSISKRVVHLEGLLCDNLENLTN